MVLQRLQVVKANPGEFQNNPPLMGRVEGLVVFHLMLVFGKYSEPLLFKEMLFWFWKTSPEV